MIITQYGIVANRTVMGYNQIKEPYPFLYSGFDFGFSSNLELVLLFPSSFLGRKNYIKLWNWIQLEDYNLVSKLIVVSFYFLFFLKKAYHLIL